MQSNCPSGGSYQAPACLNLVSTHTMGVCHLCHLYALLLKPGTLQSSGAQSTASYRVRFLRGYRKAGVLVLCKSMESSEVHHVCY